ncbi:uncharacterized protein LOC103183873 [Callorhinchus milii]|uniref:Bcl-2-like protein 15 n=1 Tax=Callorhinchus milii TaxID=7868 RepID=V9KUY2_CALMI|nr:uncharacterized protein LOC103183873 [Callorhinchus milii]|eukprot:gi/632967093/ref/XP_007899788.1/ PREDICTED: bcl-2-like protein 15 [Callorhinchus milii]
MADSHSFEKQTKCLMDILLQEELEVDSGNLCFRSMQTELTEEECALKNLGQQLRTLGDQLNEEQVKSFTKEFQKMMQTNALDKGFKIFSDTVKSISQTWVSDKDLPAEKTLLKIMASLGIQAAKQMPSLAKEISEAMMSFSMTSLKEWVTSQGGWENIHLK